MTAQKNLKNNRSVVNNKTRCYDLDWGHVTGTLVKTPLNNKIFYLSMLF